MKDEINFDAHRASKYTLTFVTKRLEKSLLLRLLIGFVLIATFTSFFYLHNVRLIIPPIDSIAQQNIISPIDFNFLNEIESQQKRQEALKELGPIYKISTQDIEQRRLQFERSLSKQHDWRKYIKSNRFDAITQILDQIEIVLLQARYTDAHNLQIRKEVELSSDNYLLFIPENTTEAIDLPEQIWSTLISLAFPNEQSPAKLNLLIIDSFRNHRWSFEEDPFAQAEIRQAIQVRPFSVYQPIKAGSILVDKGAQVNAQHIALLTELKETMSIQSHVWVPSLLAASLLIAFLFIFLGAVYINSFHSKLFLSNKILSLLAVIALLTLGIANATEYVWLRNNNLLENLFRYPIIAPFAAVLTAILVNLQIGLVISCLLAVALSLGLSFNQEEFVIVNVFTSIITILCMQKLHWRRDIFIVNMKGGLSSIFLIATLHLYHAADFHDFLPAVAGTVLFCIISTIVIVGLLPIFESSFRIITDMSLMEYLDPLSPLLRRLSTEAPGTYQHTLVVANLAESAAMAIGANGLFCRVATMYHDIGKLSNPSYFIENQQADLNVHQLLTPLESAQVILRHVDDGIVLARKEHLPEPFIQIIAEHHGTSSTYYFYCKQCQLIGKESVDEQSFCYTGPQPSSKESAIIMIADCVEAASRCLDEFSESSIQQLVEKIVAGKIQAGQFNQAPLTFAELATIKENITQNLTACGHLRVKYPAPSPTSSNPNHEKQA